MVSIMFAGVLKILPFFAQDKFRFKIEGMKKMEDDEGLTVAHGKTETKGGNTCSVPLLFLNRLFGSQYTDVLASSANKPITNIRKKKLTSIFEEKKEFI